MRLSDIMSSMGLAHYAEVGLVLFLAAFASIVVWLLAGKTAAQWEQARQLPMEDDAMLPAAAARREGHDR